MAGAQSTPGVVTGSVVRWTIITVTHNSARALREAWHGLGLPESVEWIVVDNASSDDSVQAAIELGASRVVPLAGNCGFSRANNLALAQARGAFVLFANPDLAVEVVDLVALERAVTGRGGLVAPQLINRDGSLQPNGRGFPTLFNKVWNRVSRGAHDSYRRLAATDEVRPVCFVMGAALAGTKESFDRIGGWDEAFFLYYEDSDICLRAWAAAMPVHVVGSVRWVHGWARATASARWSPWRAEVRSMITFYRRYPHLLGSESMARRGFSDIAATIDAMAPRRRGGVSAR